MNEVWLCDGVRTPFGRYGGALAGVRADDLAALPLRALMARHPDLPAEAVDEIILGCANQAGEDNRNVARMAGLLAELPVGVPAVTVNRLCASGLEAIGQGARQIRAGEAGLILAGGVESMSRAPFVLSKAESAYGRGQKLEDTTLGWRLVNARIASHYGVETLPETAENLAAEFGISRGAQDAYAWRSQQRAGLALERGLIARELISVPLPSGDAFRGDEHPRPGTGLDALAALKPIVRPDGTVTAGNTSGLNDGAGAVLLASEALVERHGLRPRARILGMASAGVEPRRMGLGPVPAIQKLLGRLKLDLHALDVVEINEAFAAQVLADLRLLGLPDDAEHVNPKGGAIAYGHPLGASGARLVLTALHELERRQARYALVALCVGVGQGLALALERTP